MTLVELLQVVIGSGNAQASSARIAKRVALLANKDKKGLSFDRLVQINGVGEAKASVILASIELGFRLQPTSVVKKRTHDKSEVRMSMKTMMCVDMIDARGSHYETISYALSRQDDTASTVKKMFSLVATRNIRLLNVSIGSKNENTKDLSLTVVEVIHRVYATADYLQVIVESFQVVSGSASRTVHRNDAP